MSAALNHTIVHCRDKAVSAPFLAEILGRTTPATVGPFLQVELDNGVALDFMDAEAPIEAQHYAFLIDEVDFDGVFDRIKARNLDYWADPFRNHPGEINRRAGGRGVYFPDPDGHLLEVLTRAHV